MSMTVKDRLTKEIDKGIENLSNFKTGTKEKTAAVDDIVAFHKMRIDEIEAENSVLSKERELEEKRKDRRVKIVTTAIEVGMGLLTLGVAVVNVHRGFILEETGSFTSSTMKDLFRSMTNAFRINRK